jgi:CRISP-associated protein Cas1
MEGQFPENEFTAQGDLVHRTVDEPADRTVLAMVNRKQIAEDDFVSKGGSVMLMPEARRAVIASYHEKGGQEVRHPLLGESALLSEFPFIQARLLARHIRGDLAVYLPCVLR